jgi:hypothetical protein
MNADPVAISPSLELGRERLATLAAVADHLIPAAHGMPSAATVVTEARLAFVVRSRPDLLEPLRRTLGSELGDDPVGRLATLTEHDPEALAALQLVIVAGYYTDESVRERLGYQGQVAKPVNALDYPAYLEEGLLDRVIERGPIWRDPAGRAGSGAG